jgi:DNA-binding MarR family transcriptional regulator
MAKAEKKAKPAKITIEAERYVPYFLSILNNGLSWGGSRLYLELFGVGINEWRVLSALTNEPGIMASRITEMVALNKSVVSRSARALENSGHVQTRLVDGRRLLFLTPAGSALHDKIIEIALLREKTLLTGFDAAEKELLCSFLKRMQNNLSQVDELDRSLRVRKRS